MHQDLLGCGTANCTVTDQYAVAELLILHWLAMMLVDREGLSLANFITK